MNHERTSFWLLRFFVVRVPGAGLLPGPVDPELHPLLERLRLGARHKPTRARGRADRASAGGGRVGADVPGRRSRCARRGAGRPGGAGPRAGPRAVAGPRACPRAAAGRGGAARVARARPGRQ
ncbi:Exonuclease SbcC [Actinacidiphila bryophytorum]|uniref:Exonuclease SbcC n=1 Tax=Actinacidiphila bryophytorum TaxID=1436133 RepID=A0A9W4ED75_9ACTN|nr:Exonuclease SbcC [Actinacidiphila bryophytorum]